MFFLVNEIVLILEILPFFSGEIIPYPGSVKEMF